MHFCSALAFQVDRQQIGTRRQKHPDDLAAIPGVAHLRRNHREHAARCARIAIGFAVAQRGVGFVDNHHHRPQRSQHRENLLEIAFCLAHVFRAEVL